MQITNSMFHTFLFTDPVEELLLTPGEDGFISRVSFRDVVELAYSAQVTKSTSSV